MQERPQKPRKSDFTDKQAFLRASAEWAEQWNVWPWVGSDEDDEFVYEVVDAPHGR